MFDDTNVDWVPTLKLGVDGQEQDVEQVSERHERRMNRRRTSPATRQDVQVQVSQDSAMEGYGSGEGVFPDSFSTLPEAYAAEMDICIATELKVTCAVGSQTETTMEEMDVLFQSTAQCGKSTANRVCV